MSAAEAWRGDELQWEPFEVRDVTAGSPQASIATPWTSEDGRVQVGTYTCTAGAFRHTAEEDGVLYVLEGRIVVTVESDEPVEAGVGHFIFIPPGRPFVFEVRDDVRVVFTLVAQ